MNGIRLMHYSKKVENDYYVGTFRSQFKLTGDITIEFMLLTLYAWQAHQMRKPIPTQMAS